MRTITAYCINDTIHPICISNNVVHKYMIKHNTHISWSYNYITIYLYFTNPATATKEYFNVYAYRNRNNEWGIERCHMYTKTLSWLFDYFPTITLADGDIRRRPDVDIVELTIEFF